MTPESYNDNFFNYHLQDSLQSARVIIPIVKEYVQPHSVIDIGCGVGTWLSIWKENGVADILGVDGDYVKKDELLIERDEFIPFDLEKKFDIDRRFELASCLEVAEHISSGSASLLISYLCKLSNVVLFSAAIPGQEGTLHINEQYPEYWVDLFALEGYLPVDCIRSKIWSNDTVSWWYRQNALLFVKKESIKDFSLLEEEIKCTRRNFISIVHPKYFDYKNQKIESLEKELYLCKEKIIRYENTLGDSNELFKLLIKKILKKNNGSN